MLKEQSWEKNYANMPNQMQSLAKDKTKQSGKTIIAMLLVEVKVVRITHEYLKVMNT